MSWGDFLWIFAICSITMLICRVVPFFLLKGRDLSPKTKQALSLIPPAAFAALVANDLFQVDMFSQGIWPAAAILVAAVVVAIVAVKSKSLILCAVVGVVAYGALLMVS